MELRLKNANIYKNGSIIKKDFPIDLRKLRSDIPKFTTLEYMTLSAEDASAERT